MRRTLVLLAAAAALAACRAEGRARREASAASLPAGPRRDVLGGLPKMPKAVLRDTLGTPEAQNQKWSTLAPADSVLYYWRRQLDTLGWQVQADQTDGRVATMYATKDSSAMWVRIWSEPPLTWYTLIGTAIRERRAAPAGTPVRPRS